MRILKVIKAFFSPEQERQAERRKDHDKRELINRMRKANARLRALDATVSVETGRDYRGKLWEKPN